ncbi:MAG: flagellar protein FlaG [Treponema sp.]|nr:flagellar protein FlaG [Treponema sp.]
MNAITSNAIVHTAMDGQSLYSSAVTMSKSNAVKQTVEPITPTGAQVAQNIEQNLAEIKEDSQQLQKMYEMVDGRKLQFNVNKELGSVVVRVVDSNTNQVLKEIPSEDMQKLKLRLRKAIGNLFDAKI